MSAALMSMSKRKLVVFASTFPRWKTMKEMGR